jgi:hypothetical protein
MSTVEQSRGGHHFFARGWREEKSGKIAQKQKKKLSGMDEMDQQGRALSEEIFWGMKE